MESQDRVSMERTFRQVEFRAEGRRLSGTVLAYGDTSPSHRERFEPGSLRFANAIPLNLRHDTERAVAWYPGGGLRLDDGSDALRMTAELPPLPAADRALDEVRAGKLAGLSVEFISNRETRQDGLRIIQDAYLSGIGLVKAPSYQGSRVEARGKKRWAAGKIPAKRNWRLQCECVSRGGASKDCREVIFNPGAFERIVREANEGRRDVIATQGTYKAGDVLGSTGLRTLRLSLDRRGSLVAELLEPDAPAPAVEAVKASFPTVRPIMRPIINWDESRWSEKNGAAEIDEAVVDALLVKWTPYSKGWGENFALGALIAALLSDGEEESEEEEGPRRRARIWL